MVTAKVLIKIIEHSRRCRYFFTVLLQYDAWEQPHYITFSFFLSCSKPQHICSLQNIYHSHLLIDNHAIAESVPVLTISLKQNTRMVSENGKHLEVYFNYYIIISHSIVTFRTVQMEMMKSLCYDINSTTDTLVLCHCRSLLQCYMFTWCFSTNFVATQLTVATLLKTSLSRKLIFHSSI